ncbi:MAG: hypothetical protein ABL889_00170 [Terricaulis sp.]
MLDISKMEFRFITRPTSAVYEFVYALCEQIEDKVTFADECSPDGGSTCDERLGEVWMLRGVKLFEALNNEDAILHLANVPPNLSVWDLVGALPEPLRNLVAP